MEDDLEKSDDGGRRCRICHLNLEGTVDSEEESGRAMELGCKCKNDLAFVHERCADEWFKIRGNKCIMENRKPQCNEKKSRRKEVLEKRKAIDGIIKAASTEVDHLASFQPFKKFERNGVSLYLDSGFGDQLSSPMRKYIQDLLKANMEGPYGPDWPAEEKVKRREMVAPEARYIFVRRALEANPREIMNIDSKDWESQEMAPAVGFVQYRFVVEEEVPTLYVYELQLEPCVQRKGLGKFLMQLIELIARKNHMGAVMLTVQKANIPAMRFYMTKLRYEVSSISPSRVDPLIGAEKSYEILCKTFHPEARQKLED